MLKNTHLKTLGLAMGSVLLLAACSAKSGPIEDSALVIEKMLSEPTKIYASQTTMELKFNEPENNQSGTITMNAEEKVNMEDYENAQSESSFKMNADLKLLDTASDDKSLGEVTADATGEIKVIGNDIYASLKKVDLDGTLKGIEQPKAALSVFAGLYMNKVFSLSLDSLQTILGQAQAGQEDHLKALKAYGEKEMYTDLADSKLLVVKKEEGVEKYTTSSGKKISVYHYQMGLNSEGWLTFLTTLDSKLDLGMKADLEMMTQKKDPSLAEIMDVFNQAMVFEMWIGQEDYHPYKVKVSSNLKQIGAAVEKMKTLNKDFTLSEAGENYLKKGLLSVNIEVKSEPTKTFSVKKPAAEEVTDLAPILTELKNSMFAPTNESEDIQTLLNGSEELPADLSTPTPETTTEEVKPSV